MQRGKVAAYCGLVLGTGLLVGIPLALKFGWFKAAPATHFELAAKLKSNGILVEVSPSTRSHRVATFTERETGRAVIVGVAGSNAEARAEFDKLEFVEGGAGIEGFASGRFFILAPRREDSEFLARVRRAMD